MKERPAGKRGCESCGHSGFDHQPTVRKPDWGCRRCWCREWR